MISEKNNFINTTDFKESDLEKNRFCGMQIVLSVKDISLVSHHLPGHVSQI